MHRDLNQVPPSRERLPALLLLALLAFSGCRDQPEDLQGKTEEQSPEAQLANAMALLKEDRPTVTGYRNAVEQLNTYLSQHTETTDKLQLQPEEKRLVRDVLLADLVSADQAAVLKEVERKSFTLFDAYHLDACFLFRDAAKALRDDLGEAPPRLNPSEMDPRLALDGLLTHLDPTQYLDAAVRHFQDAEYKLRLARHAFDWVMRQVHYQVSQKNLVQTPQAVFHVDWPAQDVLRLGEGEEEERARVFLALLEQLGLPGCMVTRTVAAGGEGQLQPTAWVAGVLIGNDIYLFEPRIGKQLMHPKGEGALTLRQLREQAKALQPEEQKEAREKFDQWLETVYQASPLTAPVKSAQLVNTEVWVPSNLSAVSPRMRELQGWLEKHNNRAMLHQDLATALQRFRDAGFKDARLWTRKDRPGYPTTVSLTFVQVQKQLERTQGAGFLQANVIPRQRLIPQWVHDLKTDLTAGRSQRLFNRFDQFFMRLRLEPGSVRDLLVRGRPEQAVERILELESRLDRSMDMILTQGNPTPELRAAWSTNLRAAEAQLREKERQRRNARAAGNTAREAQLREEMNPIGLTIEGLWREKQSAIDNLALVWAEPDYREHLTYFMGLAKMELAIQTELQPARPRAAFPGSEAPVQPISAAQHWASAIEWFNRYEAIALSRIQVSSELPFLTIIGSKTDRKQAEDDLTGDGPLQELRGMFRYQVYDPSDPMLKDHDGKPLFKTDGKPTIYFQRADGKELNRLDSYPGAERMELAMREALRRVDPLQDHLWYKAVQRHVATCRQAVDQLDKKVAQQP